jgi:hypothetical protein
MTQKRVICDDFGEDSFYSNLVSSYWPKIERIDNGVRGGGMPPTHTIFRDLFWEGISPISYSWAKLWGDSPHPSIINSDD